MHAHMAKYDKISVPFEGEKISCKMISCNILYDNLENLECVSYRIVSVCVYLCDTIVYAHEMYL